MSHFDFDYTASPAAGSPMQQAFTCTHLAVRMSSHRSQGHNSSMQRRRHFLHSCHADKVHDLHTLLLQAAYTDITLKLGGRGEMCKSFSPHLACFAHAVKHFTK